MSNWSLASTVDAPYWMVMLHAKYHLRLGVKELIYFLDNPEKYSVEEVSLMAEYAHIILCDADYWNVLGGKPVRNTTRQILNLQSARKICGNGWLLHIDIDEFLHIFNGEVNDLLCLPDEISEVRIENVERVLPLEASTWLDGYLRVKNRRQDLLQKHYGEKSEFYGMGLANYFHGKSFVIALPGVRQNIHGATHDHPRREIVRYQISQREAVIVHYPCITPSHFVSRYLDFLTRGGKIFPEFKHQRIFRNHLVNLSRTLSPLRAIIKGMQEMHYCSDVQARERLDDGLYEQMPEDFISRMRASVFDSQALGLAWADRSFASHLGLLRI